MPKTARPERQTPDRSLVGLWFHSFTDDRIVQWQGQILGRVTPDVYLVQLYEWITGSAGATRLVSLAQLMTCEFYETNAAMVDAYEYQHKYRVPHDDKPGAHRDVTG